jgi:hypothetical protein
MYKNSVRTSQETHYVSATNTNRLMLFRETYGCKCPIVTHIYEKVSKPYINNSFIYLWCRANILAQVVGLTLVTCPQWVLGSKLGRNAIIT